MPESAYFQVWELLPGFYTRGDFKDIKRERKFARLKELEIDTVICLVKADDIDMHDFEAYHVMPIPDGLIVPVQKAHEISDRIIGMLNAGCKVLIHCHAGRNRTGLISAFVLKKMTGWDGETILQHMRDIKPKFLTNPVYEEYVRNM